MLKGDYIFSGGEPRRDRDYWTIIHVSEICVVVANETTGQIANIDRSSIIYDDDEWVCVRSAVKVVGDE